MPFHLPSPPRSPDLRGKVKSVLSNSFLVRGRPGHKAAEHKGQRFMPQQKTAKKRSSPNSQ